MASTSKATFSEQSGSKSSAPFKVLTWNVLASVHTHWDSDVHNSGSALESDDQRVSRHQAIVKRILLLQPDVVLLQEADDSFIPYNWECGLLPCGYELTGYRPFISYTTTKSVLEGTVILLKEDVWEINESFPIWKIEKSHKSGWKNGIGLCAQMCHDPSQVCCFMSVHLRWGDENAKLGMLNSVLSRLPVNMPALLAGDFNTECDHLEPLERVLQSCGLHRISFPPGSTGTCKDHASPEYVIDHMYCTQHLMKISTSLGSIAPPPLGPWTEGSDGSDHTWLLAEVSLNGLNSD
jgi:endonuclease/exonuclease/phosphatase family metal-dependent hydrolase